MKYLIIIGAGGVGRETALLVEQINENKPTWNLLGFLDDNEQIHNTSINGYKVIGGVNRLELYDGIYVVCAIANYEVKKKIVDKVKNYKVGFANIIHPSVYIASTNIIGEDVIIYPGVIMTTNIRVGDHVIISPKCGIGHEAVIEDYASLLWNVNISGNVKVGEGCLIGSGATVIQSINVGRESIVGAGAVVVRDIREAGTYVGVPARRK